MSDRDSLLDLALSASDGARVDWDREAGDRSDESERRIVRALGLLASVLGEHRRLHGEADAAGARRSWGPLEILGQIGQGSFGKVYRARDPRLDRTVALKLRPADPSSAETLVAEGRLMARVRHPNVVTVHGADIHDGMVGIWMELVEGPSLADHVREQGLMSASEAIAAGIDLCAALAAVHASGLVHGDVKPQNIVRGREGRLILTDFGAGRDLTQDAPAEPHGITGTPLFMAPEAIEGGAQTARSDIYSLGAVLFHLLTARYPVEASTLTELRSAHAARRLRALRDLRPDLPDRLVAAVDGALAREPKARFESAGEMEAALIGALRGSMGRKPRLMGVLVGAAAAVALLVAAATLLRPGPAGPDPRDPAEKSRAGAPERAPVAGPAGALDNRRAGGNAGSGSSLAGDVTATLFRAGQAADEALETGARVRPGDRLYVQFRAEAPMHVYVVNIDRLGGGYLLFPVEGAQWRNPLAAGTTYRLPGDREWGSDSWEITSAGGKDSIIMVASARPLERLEGLLSSLPAAAVGGQGDPASGRDDVMRGVARLADAVRVQGGGAPAVAAALRELASGELAPEDVIVREVILDNP